MQKLKHPDYQNLSDQKTAKLLDILNAAQNLLIEEGYAGLSMRKIAARSNMTVGNLTYYFKSKQDLVHVLLVTALQGYIDDFDDIMGDASLSPEEQFSAGMEYLMVDLTTRETTFFFPELWAMANHDPVVNKEVEGLYILEQGFIGKLVMKVRPDLTEEDCKRLSLYISASIEGHTLFIGHKKGWNKQSKEIISLAVTAFLNLVKTYPQHL